MFLGIVLALRDEVYLVRSMILSGDRTDREGTMH